MKRYCHITGSLLEFKRVSLDAYALSPEDTPFPLKLAIRKSLSISGYLFAEILNDPTLREQAKTFIIDGLNTGTLIPCIDAVFSFSDMREAQVYLERHRRFGKVVVTV